MSIVNYVTTSQSGNVTLDFNPRTEASPTHGHDGTPIVYVTEPSDDRRHIALGKFMDAWSHLESALGGVLARVTGVDPLKVHVLMNALGVRGDLDVLTVLGPTGLNEQQARKFNALLERVKTNNTRRNNIVHGRWLLEIRLYDWGEGRIGYRNFQYRYYEPNNPETRKAVMQAQDKRARDKYMFSIQRITALAAQLGKLADDIMDFENELAGTAQGSRALIREHLPLRP